MKTPAGRFDRVRRTRICELRTLIGICIGTFAGLFGICGCAQLRLNSTGSLPLGLYVVSEAGEANLAEFCPPEPYSELSVARGYRSAGDCPDGDDPLLKPIVAKAGDVVVLSKEGLEVNGVLLRNTAPRPLDTKGKTLPHIPYGTYLVNRQTVWVASSYHPFSFDSRYFGPIKISTIRHKLKPFLTL